ncbi:MAG: NaeI family type II restriction endonuclease [Pseudolysinimonas sp.]
MPEQDDELVAVHAAIQALDPQGRRFAQIVRDTFDQLYDGQRTGRFRWDQLSKTERAHYGSLIEINIQRTFGFEDGDELDFKIAGVDVDCKFSESGSWMIPPISNNRLALVVRAVDRKSEFSVGVVRITSQRLNTGLNWDKKVTLNDTGRAAIQWIHRGIAFAPNLLAELASDELDRVLSAKVGQARVSELLRVAKGRRITGNVIATVAQQKDFMRRLRDGGGAREKLREEGFLVIGGDYRVHVFLAEAFEVEVPEPGEVVSFQVVHTDISDPRGVPVGGGYWRRADQEDHVDEPAPLLPSTTRSQAGH